MMIQAVELIIQLLITEVDVGNLLMSPSDLSVSVVTYHAWLDRVAIRLTWSSIAILISFVLNSSSVSYAMNKYVTDTFVAEL